MKRALLMKALGDAKLLLGALMVMMLIFPIVYLWASSRISVPAFTDFLVNALPKRWQRVWGVPISQMATPAGRVALLYVHPLVTTSAVAWAIARGSDCVSGEIGRGTMEMLLAQPVRRTTVYAMHAVATMFGSAILSVALWCGMWVGLGTAPLYDEVAATLYIPPAVNLLGLMICVGGITALVSACDSQRWRTIGVVAGLYGVSVVVAIVANMEERWNWLNYVTFMSAFKPQMMVALPDEAWDVWTYGDGGIASLGLGGHQLVLFGLGTACYVLGGIIFSRREIPAPL